MCSRDEPRAQAAPAVSGAVAPATWIPVYAVETTATGPSGPLRVAARFVLEGWLPAPSDWQPPAADPLLLSQGAGPFCGRLGPLIPFGGTDLRPVYYGKDHPPAFLGLVADTFALAHLDEHDALHRPPALAAAALAGGVAF